MLCSCEVFVRMVVMLVSFFLWLTLQTSNICKGAPLVDALQPTGNIYASQQSPTSPTIRLGAIDVLQKLNCAKGRMRTCVQLCSHR